MGRTVFTRSELLEIKALLGEIRRSDRSRQKTLRGKLRSRFGFYISDFAADQLGFTPSDVDSLVRRGVITVSDGAAEAAPSPAVNATPARGVPSGRGAARGHAGRLPATFEQVDLESAGFVGWQPWDELRASAFAEVPGGPACYVVYRRSTAVPVFLDRNPGGRFKGRDPSVPVDVLQQAWVTGTHTVYIGKADMARRRLKQFADFGAGRPVGHWGGRYIWQLADSAALLVAWHAVTWEESAREYEKRLIGRFVAMHDGRRPFANLTG